MTRIEIRLDPDLLKKVKARAKQAGFKNSQEYIRAMLREHIYGPGVSFHLVGETLQKDIKKLIK